MKFAKGQIWADKHSKRTSRVIQILVVKSDSVIVKSSNNRTTEIHKKRFRKNRFELLEDRVVWNDRGQPPATDLQKYSRRRKNG